MSESAVGGAELRHLIRKPVGSAKGALVLLHGRGVDETDLFPLLDELDPERRLLGVTPGAPLTGIPPGGRHWYVIERVGHPDPRTFLGTMELASGFLDGLLAEHGIGWDRTVIGGFSQGTATSFGLALGEERPRPAGILAISGFVPQLAEWPLDLEGRDRMPVYLTHGAADPVIPVGFARQARQLLEGAGLSVTYRETPLPHTIDPSLLPEMREWIRGRTGSPGSGSAPQSATQGAPSGTERSDSIR